MGVAPAKRQRKGLVYLPFPKGNEINRQTVSFGGTLQSNVRLAATCGVLFLNG